MQTQMAEYQIVRTYIEWLCEIPWNSSPSPQQINVKLARDQLEKDHYGLEKVKNRITEYLAVLKLKKGDVRGPILWYLVFCDNLFCFSFPYIALSALQELVKLHWENQ